MLGCLMGFDILQDLRVNFDPLVKKKKKKKKELRQNSLNVEPDRRHSAKYAKHSCCTVLSLSDYNSFFYL